MNGTFADVPFLRNIEMHQGVYIDIFPLDKCPASDRLAKTFFKIVEITTNVIIAKSDYSFICGYRKKIARFFFAILRELPRCVILGIRASVCGLFDFLCSGKRLCTVSGRHGYPKETYAADWFTDTVQVIFEGKKFDAPADWDSLLANMYGDYMTLPPEKGTAPKIKHK